MGLKQTEVSKKQRLATLMSSTHFLFAVLIALTLFMALLIRLLLTSFIY